MSPRRRPLGPILNIGFIAPRETRWKCLIHESVIGCIMTKKFRD